MRLVHSLAVIGTVAALTLGVAACGGDDNNAESDLGEQAQAACTALPSRRRRTFRQAGRTWAR